MSTKAIIHIGEIVCNVLGYRIKTLPPFSDSVLIIRIWRNQARYNYLSKVISMDGALPCTVGFPDGTRMVFKARLLPEIKFLSRFIDVYFEISGPIIDTLNR